MPVLVGILESFQSDQNMKLEIAWIFTNLTVGSSDHINVLYNRGVIDALSTIVFS